MTYLRRHLVTIAGVLISAVALYYLFQSIKFSELKQALSAIRLLDLWFAPFIILTSYLLRAVRWKMLIENRTPVSFTSVFVAQMTGYLFNTLLPARAGDIVRTVQLSRSAKLSKTKVLTTLLTERLVDFGSMLALLIAVLIVYPALPDWLKSAGYFLAFATSSAFVGLAGLHFFGRGRALELIGLIGSYFPNVVGSKLQQIYVSVLEGISGLFRLRYAVGIITTTAMIWFVEVSLIFAISEIAHVDLSIGNALFLLLMLSLASMIPSSPGQVGTYEYFGITALALIGISGPSVVAFVILIHVLTLSGAIAIGLACFIFRRWNFGRD